MSNLIEDLIQTTVMSALMAYSEWLDYDQKWVGREIDNSDDRSHTEMVDLFMSQHEYRFVAEVRPNRRADKL